jgi:hypothetical protein
MNQLFSNAQRKSVPVPTKRQSRGASGSSGNFRIENGRTFSYSTCIAATMPEGMTIGNDTYYSATTSNHQRKAGVSGCDIVVVGVPENTLHLEGWFVHNYPRLVAEDMIKFRSGSIDPALYKRIVKYQEEMGVTL